VGAALDGHHHLRNEETKMITDHGEAITVKQEACYCGTRLKDSLRKVRRDSNFTVSMTLRASLNSADC